MNYFGDDVVVCTTMEEFAELRNDPGFIPMEQCASTHKYHGHPKFTGFLRDRFAFWIPSLKKLWEFTEIEQKFILRGEGILI